jgi:hypothetical protein
MMTEDIAHLEEWSFRPAFIKAYEEYVRQESPKARGRRPDDDARPPTNDRVQS